LDIISGIYCIENLINGKKYIGKSTNIDKRFKNHTSTLNKGTNDNEYLQIDWNIQFGNNFKFYLVQECPKEQLDDLEIEIIEYYNTNNRKFGYNMTDGGKGSNGYKHRSEDIQKITEKRIYATGEKHFWFGVHHTNETKEKLSKIHSGNKYALGTKRTEEQKQSLSLARTGTCIKNKNINDSSQYYGVYYSKKDKNWVANIRIVKTIRIGGYKTEIEAAKAYDK